MFTLEQKVDLILRYIATADKTQRAELKKLVIEALGSDSANTRVEDMIVELLKELGMPQHLRGYDYVIEAIRLVVSDRTYLQEITGRLYPDVAAKYDTSMWRAERNIRTAIEATFDRGELSDITRLFGNTIPVSKGKLPNGEFIASCANEIERRMKKLSVTV